MANSRTTALNKLERAFRSGKFYLVAQGGASAGKTFAIMMLLIGWAQSNRDKLVTVVGESYSHLKGGAVRDFMSIMKGAGIFEPERWGVSSLTYTFCNDSVIEFKSIDKMGAHGPRRDILFVNEANDMAFDTFDQLATRTRRLTIIDFNPTAEFWAHTEILKKHPDDCVFVLATYKDNEALSERERANIERHAPKDGEPASNWWNVYGLGQIGSLEGNVYEGWTKASPEDYEGARLIRYGLDFGFSNDESAMVSIWERPDGALIVKQELYKTGLLGSEYCATLNNLSIDASTLIICDSARPEIIAELRKGGFRAVGADKNAGSVLRGIDRVKQHRIFYDGKDLEREYLSYAWRKKRTGEVLDEPVDGNDHCLAGDTKIKTLRGDIPIGEMIGKTGWVWCEERKLRYFRNVRKTGREEVFEIKLNDGSTIKCSPEHPIYTINRGVVPARLLNSEDMIQLDTYEGKDNQPQKTKLQWRQLLARQKFWVLSKRSAQAPHSAQGSMGISQRKNPKQDDYRPHRQEQGQQPNRKLAGGIAFSQQPECFASNNCEKTRPYGQNPPVGKGVACVGRGKGLALEEWQRLVERERINRKTMRTLWEKILYTKLFDKGALLLWKMQNARKKEKAQGTTRKYTKMSSRRSLGVMDVYCLDVYDTSNFALDNGIIVSNCLDATRYAIDDLGKQRFDF